MSIKAKIEALLFVSEKPVSAKELAGATGAKVEEVKQILAEMETERADSGIVILNNNDHYMLVSNPAASDMIKDFLNAELREKLSEASLETLAVISYKQPVSRAEIEAIRGVNSQYTLRLLTMRGLIEKAKSASDSRIQLYKTTHEFLQHMGLTNKNQLPDFEELTAKVKPPEGFNFEQGNTTAQDQTPKEGQEENETEETEVKPPENDVTDEK